MKIKNKTLVILVSLVLGVIGVICIFYYSSYILPKNTVKRYITIRYNTNYKNARLDFELLSDMMDKSFIKHLEKSNQYGSYIDLYEKEKLSIKLIDSKIKLQNRTNKLVKFDVKAITYLEAVDNKKHYQKDEIIMQFTLEQYNWNTYKVKFIQVVEYNNLEQSLDHSENEFHEHND